MKLLVDTHLAVWFVDGDNRLKAPVRRMMEAADQAVISAATIWEIAIKFALRRGRGGDLPFSAYDAIEKFEGAGFEIASLEPLHVAAVGGLPRMHGDPFDRVIVAHAMVDNFTLLTHDKALAAYGEFVVVV